MRLVLCAVIAIFMSSIARADVPAKPVAHDYDIRRLIVSIPDFPDAPDLGIKATGAARTTQPAPKVPTRDEIVAGIVKSVRALLPEGPDGNVVVEKGTLHVTASAEDQARVAAAIAHWLGAYSTEITVQTRLLSIDHKDVAGLDPTVRSLLDNVSLGNDAEMIDDSQVNALLQAAGATKGSMNIDGPRLTLFQNQRAYVLVANQQAYVSGYALDKSPGAKAVYKPVISVVEDGTVMDVRASAASSGGSSAVSLDCHGQFSQLHGMRDSTWTDPTTHEKRPVEVPDFAKQTIDRLVTVLPHHCVLLRFVNPSAFGFVSHRTAKPDQDCFMLIRALIVTPAAEKKS